MKTERAAAGTDRDLADAVLRYGDERAFREIYRRHTPRLMGFVWRLFGRTESDAEDVVQETWVRACEGFALFRWESAFSTWLLGIGLNVVRDFLRHNARSKSVQMANPPDPQGPGVPHEDRIDLERSIKLLPDGYRLVLVLHDVEGMKHKEIAGKLGISVGTSKSQLSNARKMLRAMLCGSKEIDHE